MSDEATDGGPCHSDARTRELLRAKLAGRNRVMDEMMASLGDEAPVARLQTMFRACAAPGVYEELVVESRWGTDEFTEFVASSLERIAFG